MAVITAFSGLRLSGKTELSKLIKERAEEYGIHIDIISFATPLKKEFCNEKKIGIEMLMQPHSKELYREAIEEFSIRIKQERGKDYFSTLLFRSILPYGNYCIDDLRLIDDEAVPLLQMGAHVYRVHADKEVRMERGLIPNPKSDNSRFETELDLPQDTYRKVFGTNWIFNNTQSISNLLIEADIIVRKHFLYPKFDKMMG